eukprot:COSAG04_NODE_3710_length_2591_cov_1.081059_2_plen_406_part_01
MEEIYVLLFQAKVFLDKKAKKPRERGDPQPFATKLMYGGGGLAGVVAVVWLPLFAFSSANIFQNELNNVVSVEVSFDIQISGQSGAQAFASRYPLFTSQSAQILSSPPDSVLLQVDSAFVPRNFEATFPTAVERETVQQVTVDRDAQTSWSINVPARAALTQALLRNSTLCRCQLTYAFTRGDSGTEPVSTGRTPARIEDGVPLTLAEKLTLYNMITNESLAASTLKGRKAKKALRKRIGPNEETLLHYAARTGNLDVTKTILAHPKTEVDAVSKDGHTALILAAMSGNYKVCKAIIQAGADATIHSSIDLIAAADAGDVKNGDADPSGASDSRVNEDEDRGGGGGHANTHWEKRDSDGTIQDVGYVPPRKLWKKLKKLLPSDFQQRWWNEKLEKDPDLKAEAGRV